LLWQSGGATLRAFSVMRLLNHAVFSTSLNQSDKSRTENLRSQGKGNVVFVGRVAPKICQLLKEATLRDQTKNNIVKRTRHRV
jgi:hypothetical protein